MTVSSTTRKAGPFAGNGVATAFPFTFKVFDKTDVKVLRAAADGVATTLVLDSDYSITLSADQNTNPGGTITYPIAGAPLPRGYVLVALGTLADLQPTDITNSGGFYPSVIEDMVDRSTIQIQQVDEKVGRALVVTEIETTSPVLPAASARAGSLLGFDAIGNVEMMPITASVGAGDLKNERWQDGTDYIAGVSSTVTLSRQYGTKANLGTVVMQGIAQDPNSYSLSGLSLTFDAVIPLGVSAIWCVGGTTLSLEIPPDGSVTTAKLVDGAVTASKLPDGVVTSVKLAAQSVDDSKVSTTSKLYHRINDVVFATDPPFNVVGDGVADNTAAFNAAIAYCIGAGKTLFVPAGNYRCNGQVVGVGSFQMNGEGVNKTSFTFPTNAGFLFTLPDQFHSVHLSDFTVLGGAVGTGNAGIKLTSTAAAIPNPANTQLSDITNVNINGSDGIGNAKYFPAGVEIQYVSNVNLVNVSVAGTTPHQGTGLWIHGSAALPPNVYNCTGCTFNFLNVGVEYGDYVQGLTLTQCNFTGCNYGLDTAAGLHILVQLAVNNSQFNCFTAGINLNTEIPDLLVNGNLFFIPGPATGVAVGINLARTGRYAITGNSFTGYDMTANADAIVVNTNLAAGVITGNSFNGVGFGVVLQAPSTGNNVQSNAYSGVGTAVSNIGTGNTVGGGSS